MRILFLIAALCLAACKPQAAPEAAQSCTLTVVRPISFSAAEQDSVIARALGPTCAQAVAVYAIHDSSGHPLWSWSEPMNRAFGEQFNRATPEEVQSFLERWAAPALEHTGAAPPWSVVRPEAHAGAGTNLDEATYEDLRTRNLPMLCHLTGVGRETCVFWEPAAAGAGVLYDRDVRATQATEEQP